MMLARISLRRSEPILRTANLIRLEIFGAPENRGCQTNARDALIAHLLGLGMGMTTIAGLVPIAASLLRAFN